MIEFLTDGNTNVEGKLEVGPQATVEYRSAEGKGSSCRPRAPVAWKRARA
jgi:hypothetical protein